MPIFLFGIDLGDIGIGDRIGWIWGSKGDKECSDAIVSENRNGKTTLQ